MIARRTFLGVMAGGLLAAPLAVEGQRLPRVPHVAFLDGGNIGPQNWQATRDGLRELGYVEGRNVIIDVRSANGHFNQLPDLLAELIRLRIDVIVVAGDPVVAAAKQTTSAVPVVMAAVGDPVGRGFVASLARPGGNITGTSLLTTALTGKWLELAKALDSRIARVAILENGANQTHQLFWAESLTSAREIALAIFAVDVRSADDFERAFASMAQQMVGAVIVLPDPMLFAQRARLREFVAKYRLPIISSFREEAESGGLISYGPSLRTTFRRAAVYVDKILKGAKPADLPVEQPTTFELVINLTTAKALGLTIPPSLLQRADQVIE